MSTNFPHQEPATDPPKEDDVARDTDYVFMHKELFERLVSDSAEHAQRTYRITWNEPHHIIAPTLFINTGPEGDVYVPTVTIEYPDEP